MLVETLCEISTTCVTMTSEWAEPTSNNDLVVGQLVSLVSMLAGALITLMLVKHWRN